MRIIPGLIWILLFGIILIIGASIAYQMLQRQKAIISQKQSEVDSLKKSADNINIAFGKSLFMNNCSPCHSHRRMTDDYTLGDVVERLGDQYLMLYLTKQDSLIAAKDKHAIDIKTAYNNQGNSHNFNFTRPELDAIIAFLDYRSKGN